MTEPAQPVHHGRETGQRGNQNGKGDVPGGVVHLDQGGGLHGLQSTVGSGTRCPPPARAATQRSVVAGLKTATGAEEFKLWTARDQAFGRVEHLDDVMAVGSDHGCAEGRPPVQVQRVHLGGRHLEPTADLL